MGPTRPLSSHSASRERSAHQLAPRLGPRVGLQSRKLCMFQPRPMPNHKRTYSHHHIHRYVVAHQTRRGIDDVVTIDAKIAFSTEERRPVEPKERRSEQEPAMRVIRIFVERPLAPRQRQLVQRRQLLPIFKVQRQGMTCHHLSFDLAQGL
jgi:hypothetical protein